MTQKNPYQVIKHQHVTEKAVMLQQLKDSDSSSCLRRCEAPKYVFIVDPTATKTEIAGAVEEIYKDKNVKVVAVNTISVKGKPRRMRGYRGKRSGFKKAVVTLAKGDTLDDL